MQLILYSTKCTQNMYIAKFTSWSAQETVVKMPNVQHFSVFLSWVVSRWIFFFAHFLFDPHLLEASALAWKLPYIICVFSPWLHSPYVFLSIDNHVDSLLCCDTPDFSHHSTRQNLKWNKEFNDRWIVMQGHRVTSNAGKVAPEPAAVNLETPTKNVHFSLVHKKCFHGVFAKTLWKKWFYLACCRCRENTRMPKSSTLVW